MQDGMDTKLQTQLALMNFHKKQVLCIGDRAGNCPMQDGRDRYRAIILTMQEDMTSGQKKYGSPGLLCLKR